MDLKPEKMKVAMSYVPWQSFQKSYEPKVALKRGTIFPELDKPFLGAYRGKRV